MHVFLTRGEYTRRVVCALNKEQLTSVLKPMFWSGYDGIDLVTIRYTGSETRRYVSCPFDDIVSWIQWMRPVPTPRLVKEFEFQRSILSSKPDWGSAYHPWLNGRGHISDRVHSILRPLNPGTFYEWNSAAKLIAEFQQQLINRWLRDARSLERYLG